MKGPLISADSIRRFLSAIRTLDPVRINPIHSNAHRIRKERASKSIATKILVQISFGQGVKPFYAAALPNIEKVRKVPVVLKLIVRETDVRRTAFRLNVVEVAKVMVSVDLFDFNPFFPIS